MPRIQVSQLPVVLVNNSPVCLNLWIGCTYGIWPGSRAHRCLWFSLTTHFSGSRARSCLWFSLTHLSGSRARSCLWFSLTHLSGSRARSCLWFSLTTHLSAWACEVAACIIHAQDPGLPITQFRQLEVRVTLPEAGASPQHALAGEAGTHGQHPRPSHELPFVPRLQKSLILSLEKRPAVSNESVRYGCRHRYMTAITEFHNSLFFSFSSNLNRNEGI
jgi:hypothetical protein